MLTQHCDGFGDLRVLGVAVPAGNRGCSREKVQGLALASARPAKVLIAVLVSSPAMLSGLEAMPPGLPVILCPLYHMEASQEVLATALTHLVFSKD